jgi:single-strand DNA-binding protein
MINKAILVGNLGADPEVKQVGETQVANFRMATSETYTDKQGVKQTITEWHNVVAWRKLAEIVQKYVTKGSRLYVEGKLRTRSYDDANGVKHYVTEIVADTIKMLGSANSGTQQQAQSQTPPPVDSMEGSDDLPF